MTIRKTIVLLSLFACSPLCTFSLLAQSRTERAANIPLIVSPGVPFRLYLTKRISKKNGEIVHAKLLDPVFAFDREVIPAGAEVLGTVSHLDSVSKLRRVSAILGGDFTPLHIAKVQFTSIVLPDGRKISLRTEPTTGSTAIFSPVTGKKPKQNKKPGNPDSKPGVLGTARQQAQTEIQRQISGRTRGVIDLVRGPDKKERLEDYLIAKLPYHPQWVRKGTRFDAKLMDPLQFGSIEIKSADLTLLGSQPPPDATVHARLTTPLNSGTARQGQEVQAVISQPLFSAGKLILPEGSQVKGHVTLAHRAKWLHRGGQLRFSFDDVSLPPGLDLPVHHESRMAGVTTTATLAAAAGKTSIKVDEEGGVKAVEPKTRFIAPAISVLIAAKSLDNDEGRQGAAEGNPGGRTLGGFSGLGLLGAISSQSSKMLGSVLGIYGMGVSVYTNILARGGEGEFGNNAAIDIRFGSRQHSPGPHVMKHPASPAAAGGASSPSS
jgi:hypothetical protein